MDPDVGPVVLEFERVGYLQGEVLEVGRAGFHGGGGVEEGLEG